MRVKGKSGQQVGQDNKTKVEHWVAERNQVRDWDEYASKGRINRSVVAAELDFGRSVTTQNPEVRKLLEDADKLWFKSEATTKATQEASIERSQELLGKASTANNKLAVRVAELEAENRQLRHKLSAYKRQQSLIEFGAPGCKI
jgi:hypothetical protein